MSLGRLGTGLVLPVEAIGAGIGKCIGVETVATVCACIVLGLMTRWARYNDGCFGTAMMPCRGRVQAHCKQRCGVAKVVDEIPWRSSWTCIVLLLFDLLLFALCSLQTGHILE